MHISPCGVYCYFYPPAPSPAEKMWFIFNTTYMINTGGGEGEGGGRGGEGGGEGRGVVGADNPSWWENMALKWSVSEKPIISSNSMCQKQFGSKELFIKYHLTPDFVKIEYFFGLFCRTPVLEN